MAKYWLATKDGSEQPGMDPNLDLVITKKTENLSRDLAASIYGRICRNFLRKKNSPPHFDLSMGAPHMFLVRFIPKPSTGIFYGWSNTVSMEPSFNASQSTDRNLEKTTGA